MLRLTISLLLSVVFLSSCKEILKLVVSGRESKSIAEDIRISSQSKPEIVAAFEAIAGATHEHNRVLIQYLEKDQPANELAFSAGLEDLTRSARKHTGLGRQIINAVATARVYEKDLFVPFDTMHLQLKGMPSWSNDPALQRRGYIQIIDQQVATFDGVIVYLERGEEPWLRRNFDKQAVPREVADEFFRLRRLASQEIDESKQGMFREQRSSLQCYRDALASGDQDLWNKNYDEAKQHELKAKEFQNRMIAEIRKQLDGKSLVMP